MIESPYPQRSPEWHQERLGLPTASHFEEMVDTKGNPSKSRDKYLMDLACEVITGRQAERFVSWKMKQAAEREPEARLFYEISEGVEIREVGLCYYDERKMWGASPDGLIDPDGGFETKDAEPHVQGYRLLNGWSKAEHFQQVQGNLQVTKRRWWILQSYCEGMRNVIIRYDRDDEFIEKLRVELERFCMDLAIKIRQLKGE